MFFAVPTGANALRLTGLLKARRMSASLVLPPRGLFLTGTCTGVGKTFVAGLIARELVREGVHVGVYKPAASGARWDGAEWVWDDVEQLWVAAGQLLDRHAVCPQHFRAPVAPYLAAESEGRVLDEELLVRGAGRWAGHCECLIVEGAGGFMSPLSRQMLNADVAAALGYPLLIVAANRLGVINQTLQTLLAIRHARPGNRAVGIVLNDVSESGDASHDRNLDAIQGWTDVPVVGCVSYKQQDGSDLVRELRRTWWETSRGAEFGVR